MNVHIDAERFLGLTIFLLKLVSISETDLGYLLESESVASFLLSLTTKPTRTSYRGLQFLFNILIYILQATPDNSNLQGRLKELRVIGSSSYRG